MNNADMRNVDMKKDDMKLSLHLAELRKRLFLILLMLAVTMAGGLWIATDLVNYLQTLAPASAISWHAFSPWDSIRVYMQAAFLCSVAVSMPFTLYQLWAFVRPGLRREERSAALRYIPLATVLFAAGLIFAYFVVFRSAFRFAATLNDRMEMTETYGTAQYFSFMFSILLPVSLIFELPAVLMFLTKLRLIRPAFLRKYRRHAYLGLIAVSTFIAPPDFVSNLLIAAPLLLLFELSVMLSSFIHRRQLLHDLASESAIGDLGSPQMQSG
ncbi:twin-arginine translocase subunit TatC [Cohnella soli]|uniref:Sec-independent protein translocase protein TatC n=1 Tax=Cohnella soli TaxID=425005 RepID=A0ABW0HLX5_9BACL